MAKANKHIIISYFSSLMIDDKDTKEILISLKKIDIHLKIMQIEMVRKKYNDYAYQDRRFLANARLGILILIIELIIVMAGLLYLLYLSLLTEPRIDIQPIGMIGITGVLFVLLNSIASAIGNSRTIDKLVTRHTSTSRYIDSIAESLNHVNEMILFHTQTKKESVKNVNLAVLNDLESLDPILDDLIQKTNSLYDTIIGKEDEALTTSNLTTSNDRDVRPIEHNP